MTVIWHDLECGRYAVDLPLWRSLAATHGDPVLDVGAGTGRVALDLARHGHEVTALDHDPELVTELRSRAAGTSLDAVLGDAREFELGRQFRLCIVPMQTIQLLGGSDGRGAFLLSARRHLTRGGTLAVAISETLESYETANGAPAPLPDVRELEGIVYSSQPVAVRVDEEGFVLERRRETVGLDGTHITEDNAVRLDRLHPTDFEREAIAAGFTPAARMSVPASDEYTGSIVVIAHA